MTLLKFLTNLTFRNWCSKNLKENVLKMSRSVTVTNLRNQVIEGTFL